MTELIAEVPEDVLNPGYDVLRGEIGTRTHYIHNAMASVGKPMTLAEIGDRAAELARQGGYPCKPKTFAPQTTRSHLASMRDKPGRGYAEQLPDGRWQLTARAWEVIKNPDAARSAPAAESGQPAVRTVDDKGRLLLPKEFANATVTIEMVSEKEIRIQKAVVLPEAALPLMEGHLAPLSDRDRDMFLDLIDNPPEPTAAFRAAARKYNKRHGR